MKRRHFLKNLGIGVVAAPVTPVLGEELAQEASALFEATAKKVAPKEYIYNLYVDGWYYDSRFVSAETVRGLARDIQIAEECRTEEILNKAFSETD
jgi:hypothetical protein